MIGPQIEPKNKVSKNTVIQKSHRNDQEWESDLVRSEQHYIPYENIQRDHTNQHSRRSQTKRQSLQNL